MESSMQPVPTPSIQTPKKRKISWSRMIPLYMLMLPMILSLFIFNYIPMYGIIIAFKNFSIYKGFWGSDWVGLDHFVYFLKDERFWIVMKNTLLINFYDILFGFTAPILFALLANELYQKTFKRVMQTISYLPHFLSWIVVSGIFYQIFSPEHGLFNEMLNALGFQSTDIMTQKDTFRGLLVFADIWKSVGWSAILYFAVIAGIDTTLYEAAWIDGASRFKQAIHITIPHLMPMITLLFLLKIANIFEIGFDRIFVMQNPLVYDVSDVISTYVYRVGLEQAQYSLTTAISLTQSVLGFLLLISSNYISKRATGLGLY